MSISIPDLILTGLAYVAMTYFIFRLMRKRRTGGTEDEGGEKSETGPPQIDLPTGVTWPDASPIEQRELQEH